MIVTYPIKDERSDLIRRVASQLTIWERILSSCNESLGFLGLVSPGWWKCLGGSVVSCKSVDSWLNQNESEFSVSVGSEFLNMLSYIDGFFDKMIEIFWEVWSNSGYFQNSEDLLTSDMVDLRNTILISENNTDLRWWWPSLGHSCDLLGQVSCWDLSPTWWCFSVWKTSAGNTLSLGVHSTHWLYLIINNE